MHGKQIDYHKSIDACGFSGSVRSLSRNICIKETAYDQRPNLSEGIICRSLLYDNPAGFPKFMSIAHEPGYPFVKLHIIMNHCGISIMDVKKSTREISEMLPSLVPQASNILSTLRERHILHLDIKPDNLLLNGDKLTLIDFSCAVLNSPCTYAQTGHYGWSDERFSFRHMCPEYDSMCFNVRSLTSRIKDPTTSADEFSMTTSIFDYMFNASKGWDVTVPIGAMGEFMRDLVASMPSMTSHVSHTSGEPMKWSVDLIGKYRKVPGWMTRLINDYGKENVDSVLSLLNHVPSKQLEYDEIVQMVLNRKNIEAQYAHTIADIVTSNSNYNITILHMLNLGKDKLDRLFLL